MSDAFHDYEVLSLAHDPNEATLQFIMWAPSGELAELLLRGCSTFRVCDLISQNVIHQIIFSSGASVDEGAARKSLNWVSSLSASQPHMNSEAVAKVLKTLLSGEAMLVEFVPSYGAEIVALCQSYELKPLDSA